jgi:hypothetical protein
MFSVFVLSSKLSGTISANHVVKACAETLSRMMRKQLSHILFKCEFINQSVSFVCLATERFSAVATRQKERVANRLVAFGNANIRKKNRICKRKNIAGNFVLRKELNISILRLQNFKRL